MKTVLDLLKKYDDLNETKIRDGKLSTDDEERWEELKVVYDDKNYTAVSIEDMEGHTNTFVLSNLDTSTSKHHQITLYEIY